MKYTIKFICLHSPKRSATFHAAFLLKKSVELQRTLVIFGACTVSFISIIVHSKKRNFLEDQSAKLTNCSPHQGIIPNKNPLSKNVLMGPKFPVQVLLGGLKCGAFWMHASGKKAIFGLEHKLSGRGLKILGFCCNLG